MTREENIERLRTMKAAVFAWMFTADATPEAQETGAWVAEAINGAISALKGPTREQVEKMRASIQNVYDDDPLCDYGYRGTCGACVVAGSFCSECGSPLTDRAVDILAKRLEEVLKDGG